MSFFLRCVALNWCLCFGPNLAHAQSKTPVVFIPGFAGSYLCERDGSQARVWPGKLDHFKLRLPMESKLETKALQHQPCGVLREPIRLFGIRVSDVYGKFVEHLNRQMAQGVSVVEFPYDWRLSVEHNARELRAKLDRELPGKTVDIVAHSFGGLVARYFIQNLGGENRVRQLVTMGTPHRGSVDTFETLYEGWGGSGAGLKDSAINLWMGGPAELRKTLLTFPGFYDMLPNFGNCCWFAPRSGGDGKKFDAFDAKAWAQFSFHKQVFPGPAEQAFLSFQLDRALKLHRDTLSKALPGQHREGHRFIVTGWIETVTRVYLDDRTGERLRFEKKQGDGTVPLYSATDARDTKDASLHYAPGEHMQIFIEKSALETVARTIVGGPAPTGGGAELAVQVRTKDGRNLEVRSLEYAVTPGAAGPGEPLRLTLKLNGEAQLSSADLSNIAARVVAADGITSTPLDLKPQPQGGSGSVTLTADFAAPKNQGAHLVLVRIPGLAEEYKDVFVVIEN